MIIEKYNPQLGECAAKKALLDMIITENTGTASAETIKIRLSGAVVETCEDTFYIAHEKEKCCSRLWNGWGRHQNAVGNFGHFMTLKEMRGQGVGKKLLEMWYEDLMTKNNPPLALFCTTGSAWVTKLYSYYGFTTVIPESEYGPLYMPLGDSPKTFGEFCNWYYEKADRLHWEAATLEWRHEIDCLLKFALLSRGIELGIGEIKSLEEALLRPDLRAELAFTENRRCVGWRINGKEQVHPFYKSYVIRQGHPEDFRVINQTGVKQAILNEPKHNACWDANLDKNGILYFSVCSEHTNHEFAKLYKYEFETNQASECFYTKDFLLKSDRYLRDSKFHTSIHFKPDGKLIMVTHSTDKSPRHPVWLPYSFVSNPWEGFPGGELMEYDPETGHVELLGIPAPRESIYGAVYSPKDDAYYMLGWMRGHLYRYDCKTRKCEDKGQASEYRSYRIVLGPDQNLYFSTKSGYMMRYNVDLQKIEDLHVRIPCDKTHKGKRQPFTYMGPCVTGPDGKLYTTGNYTDILSALDVKTGEMKAVGKLIPADDFIDMADQHTFVAGMDFDKNGVLWYSTMAFRVMEDEHYKVPSGLFRWDFLHGKEPEFLGLFGTKERVQTYTDSFFVDKERDILYSVSTNHSYGSPDIIAIDLSKFRREMYEKGCVCQDMLVYAPGHKEFEEFAEHWQSVKELIAQYSANVKAKEIIAVRLWPHFSATDISNAAVKKLCFVDNNTVTGICGNREDYQFTIKNGELTEIAPVETGSVTCCVKRQLHKNAGAMPHYPGRQWKSEITCECQWMNGSKLVGTEDGFLAKVNGDGSVYSIGPAICQGPVRDLCSDIRLGVAYGVGGDEEDIGNVFKYSDREGLQYLGYMSCDRPDDKVGVCANFVLSSCAISPNGKKLAVGAKDRLSCVYICTME